jgi:phosphatidylserine/phosphatidylglycerophosphate/cardiolipin synthase-like enzyme
MPGPDLGKPPIVLYPLPKFQKERYHEVHPYGPVPDASAFEHTLGIDVTLDGPVQALAVMEGMIRVIPSSGPAVSVLLKPLRQLPTVLGGSAVFVYHNLNTSGIQAKLGPSIKEQRQELAKRLKAEAEPSGYVDWFVQGLFALRVPAGQELGRLDDTGRNDGRAGIEFEIVYTTGGDVETSWWEHLTELIDVSKHKTRRLDPAAFYARLHAATGQVRLKSSSITDHTDHPLLERLTRRTLLEMRDEYDRPLTGDINVTRNQQTTTETLDPGQWSTLILDQIPPDVGQTHAPLSGTYRVERTDYTLNQLPTSNQDEREPQKSLTTPAHWPLQAIFMADRNDPANWFPEPHPTMQRFTAGNRVTPLVDGAIEAFPTIYRELKELDHQDHFFRLAAWSLDKDVTLTPRNAASRFFSIVEELAQNDVRINMLIWDSFSPLHETTTKRSRVDLDQIQGVEAVLDDHTAPGRSSHHQKLAIMKGKEKERTIAFCGGMDIWPDRLDTSEHNGFAKHPYHDVHAMIEGPAVVDLNRTFVQRWNHHPECINGSRPSLPNTAPPVDSDPGTHYVQVTRTFPKKGEKFPFAPAGDFGSFRAVLRAIQRAEKYIYLEDQFAWPYDGPFPFDPAQDTPSQGGLGLLTELLDALKRIEYLVIVVPNHVPVPLATAARYRFFNTLHSAARDKVFIFYLEQTDDLGSDTEPDNDDTEVPIEIPIPSEAESLFSEEDGFEAESLVVSGWPPYSSEIMIHSKIWIIDDIYVRIGSSNCTRRSFTYDTQADISVVDGAVSDGVRTFARAFRERLWGEHLGLLGKGKSKVLYDPSYALRYWKTPPSSAHIRPYDVTRGKRRLFNQFIWRKFFDPDGR